MPEEPEVIVAIDLGTTFTGVGFLMPWGMIHIVNDWPGSNSNNESKVPSRLVYNSDGTISSWGFCALQEHPLPPGKKEKSLFKIFLDPETDNLWRNMELPYAYSAREALECTSDFLREIHDHIEKTYEDFLGENWSNATVVFLFSVPTTWKDPAVTNKLRGAIKSAGFGTGGRHHRIQIDITEAEAAAVDTLKNGMAQFNEGDIFLMIDAGGGTTDLSLVQVTKARDDVRQMSQIAEVSGIGTGSVLIDHGFAHLIQKRLDKSPDVPFEIPNDLAHRMMNSEQFQRKKHHFGHHTAIATVHRILIPGVSSNFNHGNLRIEEGCLIIDNHELQMLFDPHVDGIIQKIEEQLRWMEHRRRTKQLARIVLSGGLGASHYVQGRIKEYFAELAHPNARDVKVLVSRNPQTSVVRGLLEDQKQKRETGDKPVLAKYIARVSYGVVVRETYDPKIHIGEKIETDSLDTKHKWAVDQIEWLVDKGQEIDPNIPIKRHFESRLEPGARSIALSTQFVISKNDIRDRPRSKMRGGFQDLCLVDSKLTDINEEELEFKKKRRVWGFSKGHKYYNCPVDIHVIVAPADLRFELLFKDERVSRDHDPISVKWD